MWMLFSGTLAASVVLPLTSVIRTPEHDTAVVESTRVNGNFAYSTIEGHAYKTITPLVGHISTAELLQPVYMQNQ